MLNHFTEARTLNSGVGSRVATPGVDSRHPLAGGFHHPGLHRCPLVVAGADPRLACFSTLLRYASHRCFPYQARLPHLRISLRIHHGTDSMKKSPG
jgi:hypothetical protein